MAYGAENDDPPYELIEFMEPPLVTRCSGVLVSWDDEWLEEMVGDPPK